MSRVESQAPAVATQADRETEALRVLVHGIFAITMTLLILDLRVSFAEEDGHLLEGIRELVPQAVAYFFGFAWFWSTGWRCGPSWPATRTWTDVAAVLLLASVAFLSLTPVAVSLLAESWGRSADFAVAVRVAGLIALLAYAFNVWFVLRQRTRRGEARSWSETAVGIGAVTGPVLASIVLSFFSGELAAVVLVLDFLGAELLGRPLLYARSRLQRS